MMSDIDAATELDRFTHDSEYCEAHYHELLETYPERWIAIYKLEIVGVDADYKQLLNDLERQGLPLGQVLTRFLTNEEQYWSLEDFEVLDESREVVKDGR